MQYALTVLMKTLKEHKNTELGLLYSSIMAYKAVSLHSAPSYVSVHRACISYLVAYELSPKFGEKSQSTVIFGDTPTFLKTQKN